MNIASVLSFFAAKDKSFFFLFARSSENLVAISKKFNELLRTDSPEKRVELIRSVAALEHAGDTITHEIFTALSRNFVTPFDREDIHYLALSLDDIADYIYSAAKKLQLYKIKEYTSEMMQLGDIIEESAGEVHIAVSGLKGMRNIKRVKEAIVRINSYENHADDIADMAMASLFIHEKDAVMVIKMKEILSDMETATDKCEDVANVIETIIVKNS